MHILHLDCSPRPSSHSRKLSAALVARLLHIAPDATITRRDLGRNPLPHAHADYAQTLSSPATLAHQDAAIHTQLSEQLIQEIEIADALVIGTPMNNFTVPSVFKAWIDQVLRVGRTIGLTSNGEKTGLLHDKPTYIGVASGGVYTGDRAKQPDFLTPYLIAVFACIGLHSLQFFPLQATAFSSDDELHASREKLLASMDTMLITTQTPDQAQR